MYYFNYSQPLSMKALPEVKFIKKNGD